MFYSSFSLYSSIYVCVVCIRKIPMIAKVDKKFKPEPSQLQNLFCAVLVNLVSK